MTLVDDYVRVWEAWDEKPGDPGRAKAMTAATQHIADMLGITHMEFRNRLMVVRQEGRHRELCVQRVIEET